MNLRILKKLSKRSAPMLVSLHNYRAEDIVPADGEETLYAGPGCWPRHQTFHGTYITPLKGTPLVWQRCSYECDDWDADAAFTIIEQISIWEDFDPEALPLTRAQKLEKNRAVRSAT